jgi:hypothetical protein
VQDAAPVSGMGCDMRWTGERPEPKPEPELDRPRAGRTMIARPDLDNDQKR